MGRFSAFSIPMAVAIRAETPPASTTTGARSSICSPRVPSGLVVRARTPRIRPERSSTIGPVTVVPSRSSAPERCAWRASASSSPVRAFAMP